MAIYSLAVRTTSTTQDVSAMEIFAGTTIGFRLLELGVTINTGTFSFYGFGRPATSGPDTSPVTLLAEDASNTSTGNSNISLATGAVAPTQFYRRFVTPSAIGAGRIYTFPRGILCQKNASQVLWNLSANSAVDVWVVVDE